MHRNVRRVGDQRACGVEQRAGEIEPLLDVHRRGRVLQRQPHLLGNRHEEIVEHFEHHRIGLGAHCAFRGPRLDPFQDQIAPRIDGRAPSRLHDRRRVRLLDDRRPVNIRAGRQRVAIVDRCIPFPARHARANRRHRNSFGRTAGRLRGVIACSRDGDGFHGYGFDDQPLFRDETEATAVRRLERRLHLIRRRQSHGQRGVDALIAQLRRRHGCDAIGRHVLRH